MRNLAWIVVPLLAAATPLTAEADVVPPKPRDCPFGSTPTTSHCGPGCLFTPCNDASCGPDEVCGSLPVCLYDYCDAEPAIEGECPNGNECSDFAQCMPAGVCVPAGGTSMAEATTDPSTSSTSTTAGTSSSTSTTGGTSGTSSTSSGPGTSAADTGPASTGEDGGAEGGVASRGCGCGLDGRELPGVAALAIGLVFARRRRTH